MRIASYNLYEGAQNTYPKLKEFVHEQDIDLVCLQEANGWNDGCPSRLENFAAETGYSAWVYGNSNTRFKLATFSNQPVLASQVHTEGFWHSAVHTEIQNGDNILSIWNVHLDPRDEDKRLLEAKRLVSLVDISEPAVITGDFNSLSRADHYPATLAAELAARGIAKFGTDTLRYDVTDYLYQAGLTDIAAHLDERQSTVPTSASKDPHHAAALRLDYMFITSSLIKAADSLVVPKTPLTETISDHYPVVLTVE